ncbi:winged helix DNA-binding domain-containing protein [Nocardioides panacisoli]|uniref:winged helix-turn-helix domain-containing protein n=1 Tax=Nocardioides panacisoli TaxID=627624 RepID=UPI001C62FAD8|nr:crosslink repair DNA glycosylase YcaQ family protein [Nocardioides panacisoli]QYJ04420.1 winged helix DNA-binding domain-containing protein [Nocardioides panacisoli]
MQSISSAQARRIALAAQGFADPAHSRPTLRTLQRAVDRTGVLQVDSVNVLQRAHYMPIYSRIGPYDTDLLHRAADRRPRRLVEYWAHVQALMPVDLWPVMHHRREHYRARGGKWAVVAEDRALERQLLADVTARGASTARDLDDGLPRRTDHWGWNWSRTRQMLDYLFTVGDLAIASRNAQFEIRYDLPSRVLPPDVLATPPLAEHDAHVELVRRAARSHGVATVADLRDYYRLPLLADAERAVSELVAAGELEPVRVEGWSRTGYLHHAARRPRRIRARALLSPFDPVVWERTRAEELFGFRYRIEIYTPAHKREYGYYVLPFLLDDRLVARVDLKADRGAGVLRVPAAYAEAHAPPETAAELAAELRRLADWLGLVDVVVDPRGDLAPALAAEVTAAP